MADIADAAILLEQVEGKGDPTTEAPYVRGALAILREVLGRAHVQAAPQQGAAWRVGGKQPRNVYRDDKMVAVCVGPDDEAAHLARAIVERMNAEARP